MNNTILDDYFCECGLPAEVRRVVFMHSTDPGGHTAIAFYQCPVGHYWNGVLEEDDSH